MGDTNHKDKTFSDLFSSVKEGNSSLTLASNKGNQEENNRENSVFNHVDEKDWINEKKTNIFDMAASSVYDKEARGGTADNRGIKDLLKEEKNPFFQDNGSIDKPRDMFQIAENDNEKKVYSDIFDNKNSVVFGKDSVQDSEVSLNNLFFDNQIGKNVDDYHEKKKIEENPFFSNEIDNTTKVLNNEDNNFEGGNPFFEGQNETTDVFSKNELKIDNHQVENLFFDDSAIAHKENIAVSPSLEGKKVEEKNPFFVSENSEDKQEDVPQDNSYVEGGSPFFSDCDFSIEGKSLVDDKISLVESQVHKALDSEANGIDTSNVKNFQVKVVPKKEPLIKFILGVLSYAVFIWLLLIGIALLIYVADIKIRAAKGDYSTPTFNAYVVLTGSMLPEIKVYDVIITKKVDVTSLKEGDVITFASSDTRFLNTIITHRIIKKNYDKETKSYTFQTKGDNNNVADSALVQPNNIYGKVIFRIPKLGYLQEFLASKGGWIIVILIPCLIVVSYDIVKISKGMKRKKYKNIKVQSR